MFNTESVKELAHSNPTAGAIFLAFSQRERGRHVINLDLVYARLEAEGVRLVHADYFATFKRLEELQIGQLIYGRKGNPNCFVWFWDLKDVAKIGLGSKGVEPKQVVPRAPRGINKNVLGIHANRPPMRVNHEAPAPAAPKQTRVVAPKPKKEVEALVPVKTKGSRKKYVHIKIPIEMLGMIKGLK